MYNHSTPPPNLLLQLLLDPAADWTSQLAPSIQRYFQAGLAPATHKTYNTAMRCFDSYCINFSVIDPFPVTEIVLCLLQNSLLNGVKRILKYLTALQKE